VQRAKDRVGGAGGGRGVPICDMSKRVRPDEIAVLGWPSSRKDIPIRDAKEKLSKEKVGTARATTDIRDPEIAGEHGMGWECHAVSTGRILEGVGV